MSDGPSPHDNRPSERQEFAEGCQVQAVIPARHVEAQYDGAAGTLVQIGWNGEIRIGKVEVESEVLGGVRYFALDSLRVVK